MTLKGLNGIGIRMEYILIIIWKQIHKDTKQNCLWLLRKTGNAVSTQSVKQWQIRKNLRLFLSANTGVAVISKRERKDRKMIEEGCLCPECSL